MSFSSSRSIRPRWMPCLRRAILTFPIFAVMLAPCFSSGASAPPQTSTLEALAKIREAWAQDLRAKQLEPILKFYAPDAVFLQPTGERIAGSGAIRALFQNIMATFNSDLTLRSRTLDTSGDLAYDSGDFQESLTTIATGSKINSQGSYLLIYRRQPDGSWRIVQHAWTGIPPVGT